MELPFNVRSLQGGKRREVVARFAYAEDAATFAAGLSSLGRPAVFYQNRRVLDGDEDMALAFDSADAATQRINEVLDKTKPQ